MNDRVAAPHVARAQRARSYGVVGPETATLTLPDGVALVSDIYRPDADGRFPVLLMRQPYGRRIASTVVLAHPAWYASHGYIVVVQDVRGRGDSGGAFHVLEDDQADGAATLAWAADLPHADGKLATYGFSYQAMTQLLALAGARKAGTKTPDAIAPAMGAWSVRDDWAYEGGAFRLAANVGWACQMGAEQARLAGDRVAYDVLAAAARRSPAAEGCAARPDALARYAAYAPHYEKWRSDDEDAFARMAPAAALADDSLDTPGLFVGGWLDGMLMGTLAMHAAFAAKSSRHRLIVGPWAHMPWSRSPGMLDLGSSASSIVDVETIRFFDFHLKNRGDVGSPVRLFDIGAKDWRDYDEFPDPPRTSFYLASSGRATLTTSDGALCDTQAPADEDWLVHDPWRPAPIVGGHLGQPGGIQDRAAIDDRGDVAVYTSDALRAPARIAGRIAAELHVSCDRPSHDLHCTLSLLPPSSGRALTLTSGCLRVHDAAAPGPRRVDMRAICATLEPGSRLRLSIQAAAFPAFAVNPGTGARAEDAHAMDAQVTTLRIAHGGANVSRLLLPLEQSRESGAPLFQRNLLKDAGDRRPGGGI